MNTQTNTTSPQTTFTSIFDLDVHELGEILKTNELPPGVGLQGLESRKDFDKLFKHRINPKFIAQTLLREKAGIEQRGGQPKDTIDVKQQRLELQRQALELKQMKTNGLTHIQDQIYKRLQALEDGQTMMLRGIANINEKLEGIQRTIEG